MPDQSPSTPEGVNTVQLIFFSKVEFCRNVELERSVTNPFLSASSRGKGRESLGACAYRACVSRPVQRA